MNRRVPAYLLFVAGVFLVAACGENTTIPQPNECPQGFIGNECNACIDGRYGTACVECDCVNGFCDDGIAGTGACACDIGWTGAACDECEAGFYGVECQPCSCINGDCNDGSAGTGSCLCDTGYSGADCDDCASGRYGPSCLACECVTGTCNEGIAGTGACVCDASASGTLCETCNSGFFGAGCAACTCVNGTCDDGTAGSGTCECDLGWSGAHCDECETGLFGSTCQPCTCLFGTCNDGLTGDGTCSSCDSNWTGTNCDVSLLPPSCSDTVQNGTETGADCGGHSIWLNEIVRPGPYLEVEVSGPSSENLAGWTLASYDAAGNVLQELNLEGTFEFDFLGIGFTASDVTGLGATADGLALVDPDRNVVEFVGFGVAINALDGPAMSLTSVNIADLPLLVLTGTGRTSTDFAWGSAMFDTPGYNNPSQIISGQVCGTCPVGEACTNSVDCAGPAVCSMGMCQAPSCGNGTLDVTETDVDCGNREIWFNELQLTEDGVELAGPAGLSVEGYRIVTYDFVSQLSIGSRDLHGTLGSTTNGIGFLRVNAENAADVMGNPHGIALVGPGDAVLQFVSAGTPITAGDGPAAGLVSETVADIPFGGTSIQLTGFGSTGSDFAWVETSPSLGVVNVGQVVREQACDGCAPSLGCDSTPDCRNGDICVAQTCVAAQCQNGVRDGNETDVDCGGVGVWLNEIYDASNPGLQLAYELAGPVGLDWSSWRIEYYAPANGMLTQSSPMVFDISTQTGSLEFHDLIGGRPPESAGIPDPFALALVDSQSRVVHFVSPFASVAAVEGSANGMTPEFIGNLPGVNQRLRLEGAGRSYADFTWETRVDPLAPDNDINPGQRVLTAPDVGRLCGLCAEGMSCENDADCAGALRCLAGVCSP